MSDFAPEASTLGGGRRRRGRTLAFFSDFDLRFAQTLQRFDQGSKEEVFYAAALASAATAMGRVCVSLDEFAGKPWPNHEEAVEEFEGAADFTAPERERWLETLTQSSVVGTPGEFRPLILDREGRLYLHRYWRYEYELADGLWHRSHSPMPAIEAATIRASIDAITKRGMKLAPSQRLAIATAILRRLTVICGSAGTGKTTIIACILRLLAEQDHEATFRVRVAAPTGKAANRLGEQLTAARKIIDPEGRIARLVDEVPSTLHRLLGGSLDGVRFRYNRENPLPLDALVVDESSMVDIALMAKVVAALPATARLILVGDPEQLPPVEVGSVFTELVAAGGGYSDLGARRLEEASGVEVSATGEAPLVDAVVKLEESFRFTPESGIGRLAAALRTGDAGRVGHLLDEGSDDLECFDAQGAPAEVVLARIAEGYSTFLAAVSEGCSDREILDEFARFRVLGIRRQGTDGVVGLNGEIERYLRDHHGLRTGSPWYAGRPVMVTRNSHTLRLFNGDIGIALPDADGRMRVVFDSAGECREVAPGRLSHVETVFAMTVHKSQGSEYERACLILPNTPSRLLTRELLYTAATRARAKLLSAGPRARWAEGIARRLPRSSALADVLRATTGSP